MSWLEKLLPPKIQPTDPNERRTVPEGLWIKCPSCETVLSKTDLEQNVNVCPKCSHHHRIGAGRDLRAGEDACRGAGLQRLAHRAVGRHDAQPAGLFGDQHAAIGQEGQRPGPSDLAEMVMPQGRRQQRQHGNRQQNARERQGPGQGKPGTVQIGGLGNGRQHQCQHCGETNCESSDLQMKVLMANRGVAVTRQSAARGSHTIPAMRARPKRKPGRRKNFKYACPCVNCAAGATPHQA